MLRKAERVGVVPEPPSVEKGAAMEAGRRLARVEEEVQRFAATKADQRSVDAALDGKVDVSLLKHNPNPKPKPKPNHPTLP